MSHSLKKPTTLTTTNLLAAGSGEGEENLDEAMDMTEMTQGQGHQDGVGKNASAKEKALEWLLRKYFNLKYIQYYYPARQWTIPYNFYTTQFYEVPGQTVLQMFCTVPGQTFWEFPNTFATRSFTKNPVRHYGIFQSLL